MFPRVAMSICLIALGLQSGSAAASGFGGSLPRGTPLSVEVVAEFSRQAIHDAVQGELAFTGVPRCNVRIAEVVYATVGVSGEPATASAAVFLPYGPGCHGPRPLLGWARGSEFRQSAAQADLAAAYAGYELIAFYATHGYAVVATDYLGLGKSDYAYHPYLHADSQATAIIDALRAARWSAPWLGTMLSSKVMLAGYSQGGHAAMAAQRAIERDHRWEFRLAATVAMSGPYALSETLPPLWAHPASAYNPLVPYLFSYIAVGMNGAYGTVYTDPDDVFQAPYDGMVEGLMPGALSLFEMIGLGTLPATLDELAQPGFKSAFLSDAQHPLRQALAANDLLDWVPRTPLTLCGASRDAVVPFANAQIAHDVFAARGVNVPVVDVDADIPPEVDGVTAHTSAAAYWCYSRMREDVLNPAR